MILALLVPLAEITLPPERYRSDTTSTITFAKPELVQELCGKRGVDELVACFEPPVIIVPNPCDYPDESYARIVCHEIGHANGWPADHKDETP